MKLLLAMPCGSGEIPVETVRWLRQLKIPADVQLGFTIVERTHIMNARNSLIQVAIDNGTDLLFVDDDNPPPTDVIEKLIRHNKEIVTALVPSRQSDGEGKHRLCVFKGFGTNDETGKLEYKQYMEMPEGDQLFEVENAGFGCIYIKHEVLKKVYEKYPTPCEMKMVRYYDIDGQYKSEEEVDVATLKEGTPRYGLYVSEDLLFLDRAKRLGYKVYCDPTVQCYHVGNPEIITIGTHILSPQQRAECTEDK